MPNQTEPAEQAAARIKNAPKRIIKIALANPASDMFCEMDNGYAFQIARKNLEEVYRASTDAREETPAQAELMRGSIPFVPTTPPM